MDKYYNVDTGEIWTEEEIREEFDALNRNGELEDFYKDDFEYYLKNCLVENNGSLQKIAPDWMINQRQRQVAKDIATTDMPYGDVLEVQHTKLNGSGLEPYFETLTVSEEVGVKKPNPEIFHYALRKAHATAEESLMIGDEMAVDIDGARAAGMDTLLFNPNGEKVEGYRTYEIHDLLEIKGLL